MEWELWAKAACVVLVVLYGAMYIKAFFLGDDDD